MFVLPFPITGVRQVAQQRQDFYRPLSGSCVFFDDFP